MVGRDGMTYAPAGREEQTNYLSFDVWLLSTQRGRIAEWPPRPGTRSVA